MKFTTALVLAAAFIASYVTAAPTAPVDDSLAVVRQAISDNTHGVITTIQLNGTAPPAQKSTSTSTAKHASQSVPAVPRPGTTIASSIHIMPLISAVAKDTLHTSQSAPLVTRPSTASASSINITPLIVAVGKGVLRGVATLRPSIANRALEDVPVVDDFGEHAIIEDVEVLEE